MVSALRVVWFPSLACSGRVCELINLPFPPDWDNPRGALGAVARFSHDHYYLAFTMFLSTVGGNLSLSLSLTHTHSLSLSPHTHTHTHTHTVHLNVETVLVAKE